MTWSYWCRTSTQCTVKSLSFWDRPCSSSTVSRRHRTVRLCCSVRGGPLARRTVSHCLCSTTVSALTTSMLHWQLEAVTGEEGLCTPSLAKSHTASCSSCSHCVSEAALSGLDVMYMYSSSRRQPSEWEQS